MHVVNISHCPCPKQGTLFIPRINDRGFQAILGVRTRFYPQCSSTGSYARNDKFVPLSSYLFWLRFSTIEKTATYPLLVLISKEVKQKEFRMINRIEDRNMNLKACIITNRHRWNEFVAESSYGNITQSYEWGELASYVGAKPLHLGVVDHQGKLCAAMEVPVSSLPMLRTHYLYVPRGPIIDDPSSPAMAYLLHFAKEQAHIHKAFMLKIEPGVEERNRCWSDALQRYGFRPSAHSMHLRNEWILDIRPGEDELLAKMKAGWRRNIHIAARKGVVIRHGEGKVDVSTFYHLLRQTSERNNFFVHDQSYFDYFMQLFSKHGHAVLMLAEHKGEIVGGAIMMRFGHWAWYRFGASSAQHRDLRASHLLQWKGIQCAKSYGCHYYTFLGIPSTLAEKKDPLQGVYFFKQGFGGYARCAMEGHELVYNPVIYEIYRRFRDWKHRRNRQ